MLDNQALKGRLAKNLERQSRLAVDLPTTGG
jgi:hypothetical protein